MSELVKVETSALAGEALNWAVGKAEGLDVWVAPAVLQVLPRAFVTMQGVIAYQQRYDPSGDWGQGGPLIDKHILQVKFYVNEQPDTRWRAETHDGWGEGPTPLVAACRAILADVLGETVEVPRELLTK